MIQILLMLKVLFIQDSKGKELFCLAPFGSELRNYRFGSVFKPIQDGFQYDLARMTDGANGCVVLAEL